MGISAQSKVAIEEEDGTLFIGSVTRRASRLSMKHYFMERDGYNEHDLDYKERWEGACMARAHKLLRRNGGFEDCVTMLKLGAGKR
jgi:fructose-1,6-bisphosphatase